MTIADPRMNANGEGVMRAYRIDARSDCRSVACDSERSTGSGRSGDGAHAAWLPRGSAGARHAHARVAADKSGPPSAARDRPPRWALPDLVGCSALDRLSLSFLHDVSTLRSVGVVRCPSTNERHALAGRPASLAETGRVEDARVGL